MSLVTLAARRHFINKTLLEEAFGGPIPELAEPGWDPLGAGFDHVAGLDRRRVNDEARRYYYTDATARYMVRLHNAYTFARGVSHHAADEDVNDWLGQFWRDTRNRASLSTAGAQWKLGKELQLTGELFLAFYTSTLTGKVTVRVISPDAIKRIEYVPGDPHQPAYYVWKYRTMDGQDIGIHIPDWRNADPKFDRKSPLPNTQVHIMHVLAEDYMGRGLSQLATVIPWIKALKGFMEDRATLTLAQATFAFKQKVRGNREALERARDAWSRYESQVQGDGTDGRERRQAANTIIENEATDLEQLKTDSGASNAYLDMRMFRQMAGIGMNVFEHYLGDASTGNLATATAMELPMLKMFEFEQQFWADVFADILSFVIRQGIRFGDLSGKGKVEAVGPSGAEIWEVVPAEGVNLSVETTFPPIVQKDLGVWSSAIAQVGQTEAITGQMLMPAEEKARALLHAFGYSSGINEIIDELKENNFQMTNLPTPPPTETPADPEPTEEEAEEEPVSEAGEKEVPDVGKPLPKDKALAVKPVTKKEVEAVFDDWLSMPTLEEQAKSLGMTVEELDNA
jgi:hypothetical protein